MPNVRVHRRSLPLALSLSATSATGPNRHPSKLQTMMRLRRQSMGDAKLFAMQQRRNQKEKQEQENQQDALRKDFEPPRKTDVPSSSWQTTPTKQEEGVYDASTPPAFFSRQSAQIFFDLLDDMDSSDVDTSTERSQDDPDITTSATETSFVKSGDSRWIASHAADALKPYLPLRPVKTEDLSDSEEEDDDEDEDEDEKEEDDEDDDEEEDADSLTETSSDTSTAASTRKRPSLTPESTPNAKKRTFVRQTHYVKTVEIPEATLTQLTSDEYRRLERLLTLDGDQVQDALSLIQIPSFEDPSAQTNTGRRRRRRRCHRRKSCPTLTKTGGSSGSNSSAVPSVSSTTTAPVATTPMKASSSSPNLMAVCVTPSSVSSSSSSSS